MYRPSAHVHALMVVVPVVGVVAKVGHAVQTGAPVFAMNALSGHGVGVEVPVGQK